MRRFLTVFLLTFFMTAAVLADVIIDSQVIPGSALQSIDIDPDTGNITINSNASNDIDVTVTPVGSNVTVDLSLTPSSVLINTNTTVEWTVTNATSCTASNGLGTWGGPVNPAGGTQIVNSGGSAGSFTFTISCDDGVNPAVVRNAILTVTTNPVVVINSFTVTPSNVETGTSVNASWNVSNATSCTASGDAPGWSGSVNNVSGSQDITMTAAGSYTFTLSCSNNTSNDSENRFVTVTDPTNNCTPPSQQGQHNTWEEVLQGAWPGPAFREKSVAIPRGKYLALQFHTGDTVAEGGIVTIPVTSNTGIRYGSLSPCQGEFLGLPSACTQSWGVGNALNWTTGQASSDECLLEANTTYYLNLTFVTPDTGADTCQIFGFGSNCFTKLRVYNR